MKKILWLLILSGCTLFYRVHQEHLNAWKGQPITKLENHPSFGIPTKTFQFSDGRKAYKYIIEGATQTYVRQNYVTGQVYGTDTWTPTCVNTFYIQDGIIEKYEVQGNCYTDETLLPDYLSKK